MILVKDFPTFGDLGNCNLTWESPQISTRWSQTPDKGIGTLSGKCGTQEVFDDSHLSGNIEGSQTDVLLSCESISKLTFFKSGELRGLFKKIGAQKKLRGVKDFFFRKPKF